MNLVTKQKTGKIDSFKTNLHKVSVSIFSAPQKKKKKKEKLTGHGRPSKNLSFMHTLTRALILSLLTWDGLAVWEWLVAVKGLKACVCLYGVCVVLCLIDILPHSRPVGHRKGRQMAVFRSTVGQHMAPRDKVCVCVCENLTLNYAWVEEVE